MRPASVLVAIAPLALLSLLAAGCVREPSMPVDVADVGPAPAETPLVEHQVTVAAAEDRGEGGDVSAAARSSADAPASAPPALGPASTRDPVRFQIGAAYGALSRVDVDGCRGKGLQPGYVHVRATFARAGYVVRASVASAVDVPPQALDCIADGLRQTGVPAFDGADARLSKTYFVPVGGNAAGTAD